MLLLLILAVQVHVLLTDRHTKRRRLTETAGKKTAENRINDLFKRL